MKQTWLASIGEAGFSTALGFGLSLFLQWLYFDRALGFELHLWQNFLFAVIMTGVSFGRGVLVRRLFEHFGLRVKLSAAIKAIAFERERQKTAEGYDEAHDDEYADFRPLACAGAAYLAHAGDRLARPPASWRWRSEFWKPQDARRDLVRGVALGVAAIEWLDRNRARAFPDVPAIEAPRAPDPLGAFIAAYYALGDEGSLLDVGEFCLAFQWSCVGRGDVPTSADIVNAMRARGFTLRTAGPHGHKFFVGISRKAGAAA